MTTEQTLSPQESLDLISGVIIKTREQYRKNSFYFMLWGWLIAAASGGFFALQQLVHFKYFFLPFPVLVLTGITVTLTHYFKQKAKQSVESYTDFFVARLWMVLGIGFIVVVLVSLGQKIPPFLFTMVIGAIGTLVTGLAMRFRPLIIGGALFFVAAITGVFIPDGYKPLLLALSIITGYLVPGYLLNDAKN